jgi:hypothetical protein
MLQHNCFSEAHDSYCPRMIAMLTAYDTMSVVTMLSYIGSGLS